MDIIIHSGDVLHHLHDHMMGGSIQGTDAVVVVQAERERFLRQGVAVGGQATMEEDR